MGKIWLCRVRCEDNAEIPDLSEGKLRPGSCPSLDFPASVLFVVVIAGVPKRLTLGAFRSR